MSLFKFVSLDEIRHRGTIRDVDVQNLRQATPEDGTIKALEADLLLMLNTACRVKDPSWTTYFVERLTDYVVHQAAPEGYVTAANADWLTLRFSRDRRITNYAELELVASILEEARWAPQSLSVLLLRQVRDAVISGHGPLRAGGNMGPGTISDAEVGLLRRVLTAGEDTLAVTKAETKILFDINAALNDPIHNAGWSDLYVKAVANAVMWSTGHAVPGRREVLSGQPSPGDGHSAAPPNITDSQTRREDSATPSPLDALLMQPGLTFATCRPLSPEERALARLARQRIEIITNNEIAEPDIDWLVGHIGNQTKGPDDSLGANERRLLSVIRRDSPAIHPALIPLFEKASIAA